jgi:hypothetical protein
MSESINREFFILSYHPASDKSICFAPAKGGSWRRRSAPGRASESCGERLSEIAGRQFARQTPNVLTDGTRIAIIWENRCPAAEGLGSYALADDERGKRHRRMCPVPRRGC